MESTPTRWGILGAGKIANDFLVAIKTLPAEEHKVVAIGARSLDRAQQLCKQHGVQRAYGSYDEVVADKDIEVVYISVIHPAHKKLCMLALENGKHVLCEKPFMMNLKDSKEVMEIAQKKKLFLMEAMWTRFFPIIAEVKRIVDCKEIGDVTQVTASFGFNCLHIPRVSNKELGGSVLLDMGIYCLHLVDIIYDGDKPDVISACGHKTSDDGVDISVGVNMLYGNRRMAQITTSAVSNLSQECTIFGTKGFVKICAPFWSSEKIIKSDGTEKEFPLPAPCAPMNFLNSTGMRYEIQDVRKNLLSGKTQSAIMPHSTTERIMGWMDEIRHQLGVVYDADK